jgi:hypothetical protein
LPPQLDATARIHRDQSRLDRRAHDLREARESIAFGRVLDRPGGGDRLNLKRRDRLERTVTEGFANPTTPSDLIAASSVRTNGREDRVAVDLEELRNCSRGVAERASIAGSGRIS